uniref:Uncharacterized protein n=1 Tax=Ignisphaera aggregans TaxID=334771 RepID=A0A7C4BB95_9CREN
MEVLFGGKTTSSPASELVKLPRDSTRGLLTNFIALAIRIVLKVDVKAVKCPYCGYEGEHALLKT